MTSDKWPLIGRMGVLREIADALRNTAGVVLVGPAGIGKTRLAREMLDAAGGTTRWTGATAAARGIPLGAFATLIGENDDTDASLLNRALAAVRDRIDVLAVDDAHLLDEASATLLHQLAIERAAKLVVTLRSGEPTSDAVAALWKDGLLTRLDVPALDESQTDRLLEAALGGPVEPVSRGELYAATRGNVLWLRHLVQGECSAGRLTDSGGTWRWSGGPALSPALVDLVANTIGTVNPPTARVLELLAFGEPLEIGLLATLVDREALAGAELRRLVTVERSAAHDEVRLGHPLYGEAVRARTTPLRARRLCGELAGAPRAGPERPGDRLRRAVLTLNSDLPVNADLMTDAARVAGALNDWVLAERLLRAAIGSGGGFEPQLALGLLLTWTMRLAESEVELRRAAEVAETPEQWARANCLRTLLLVVPMARPKDAEVVLTEVEEGVAAGSAGHLYAQAIRANILLWANDLPTALELGEQVLDTPEMPAFALAWAGYGVVVGRALAGRLDGFDELVERVVSASVSTPDTAPMQFNNRYFHVFALCLAGEVHSARNRLSWLADLSGAYVGMARDGLGGRIALDCGQVRTAARLLRGIRPFYPGNGGGWTPIWEAAIAQASAMAGDIPGAREALERAEPHRVPSLSLPEAELAVARAWLSAAEGAVEEAITLARDAAVLAADTGQHAVEVVARHTAVRLGDPTQAAALARLASTVDGPRAPAATAHAEALARADPDALLAAAARLETADLLLPAADAAAQAAVLHRTRGHNAQAAFATARARALAERCEDPRTPALIAGVRPLPLTAREREIATLAANGLANKQIAARLRLSVRTVEGHIYRACTRLDLPNRTALCALLGSRAVSSQHARDGGA